MGKKLTLNELAKSRTAGGGKMTVANIEDLGKQLEAAHPEEMAKRKEAEELKNPEIIDNAFNGMRSVLAEKKEKIDQALEKLQDNAEELKMEQEFGEDYMDEDDGGEAIDYNADDYDDIEEDNNEFTPDIDVTELDNYDFDGNEVNNNAPDLPAQEKPVNSPAPVIEEEEPEQPEPIPAPKEIKKPTPASVNNKAALSVTEEEDDDDNSTDIISFDSFKSDIEKELAGEDSDDDDEDEDSEYDDDDVNETIDRIKQSTKKIAITSDNLDLSKFVIDDTPVSSISVLNDIRQDKYVRTADWPLHKTGIYLTMKETDGQELDTLRASTQNATPINAIMQFLKFAYKNDVSPNKPDFETWTKMIYAEDFDDIFFSMFLSSFGSANYVQRTCPNKKCGKLSAIEFPDPAHSMVEFDDDTTEHNFYDILTSGNNGVRSKYKAEIRAISDNFAISIIPATIFSLYVQNSVLSANIYRKYEGILNVMAFINKFYLIDRENTKLVPIKVKVDKKSLKKTVMNKFKIFTDILSTLNSDQYYDIMGYLSVVSRETNSPDKVKYIIPECKCPICGETIKSDRITNVMELIFQRAQLAQLSGMSRK